MGERAFNLSVVAYSMIFLLSLMTKLTIELGTTSDYYWYMQQTKSVLDGYWISNLELPLAYFVLVPLSALFQGNIELALKVTLALCSSLVVLPIGVALFYTTESEKVKGFPLYVVLASTMAVFNPYIYSMVKYVMVKNVVGNLVLFTTFFCFLQSIKTKEYLSFVRHLPVVLSFVVLGLTHTMSFGTFAMFLAFYILMEFVLHKRLQKFYLAMMLVLFSLPLALSLFGVNNAITVQVAVIGAWAELDFNFPLFMEAFSNIRVVGSLFVFVYILRTRRDSTSSALALTGLALHVLSWITIHGHGERYLYMTYVPLALLVPLLLKSQSKEILIFIAICFILPYFGLLIGP